MPVAWRLPDVSVVMIEYGEKVVAENICDASVEVETVPTSPPDPVKAKPCVSDESRSAELKVEDAVENNPPVNPRTVDVEAPYDVKGRI